MSDKIGAHRVEVPWMTARRQRGLTLILAFGSVFWLLLFVFALITMQLVPPRAPLVNDIVIGAIGLAGSGLFGSCAVAVRRSNAYLEGTTLHYSNGWFGYRTADLARVTEARIKEDKRDDGFDLVLKGNGTLKKFPLAHPATGQFPTLSAEKLITALEANPNEAAVAEAISNMRSGLAELRKESSESQALKG